jgi:DNA-3-methyladenine glycosylase II
MRAFVDGEDMRVCVARQPAGTDTLEVALYRPVDREENERTDAKLTARIPLMLGAGVELGGFYAAAESVPELGSLVERARGVKPPRHASMWEALCMAVTFQQVSLESAMSIIRRVIAHFGTPLTFGEVALYPFPSAEQVLEADPDVLRSLGLSAAKVRTLQEAARAILEGRLTEAELDSLPTAEAMARLTRLRGIGPWTAAVVMLRGLGRLDVFPAGDSGAQRNMRGLFGAEAAGPDSEGTAILEALGPWRGMLYYHLLLWRLSTRGLGVVDL